MKHLFLIGLLAVFASSIHAQSVDRAVVSSAGQSTDNPSVSVEQTIGEVAVGSSSTSAVEVSAGFNQSYESPNIGIIPLSADKGFRLYPNPTSNAINIEIPNTGNLIITNAVGQTVFRQSVNAQDMITIPVFDWEAGCYFVQIGGIAKTRFLKL